jgi:beta-lactamase superfamily II metal-dependent hydrolase
MMPPHTDTKPTMQAPSTGVTVRMYDLQGEGDCFLLAFRDEDGNPRFMLIDCGIFVGTSGGAKRLRDIAKDIAEATGNHLHVLVATHEHWDHLIGFHYARETFGSKDMVIDEVWLAWTEDVEGDDLAKYLHQQYEAAAMALATAATQLEARKDPRAGSIKDVLGYHWDWEGKLGVTTNDLMHKVHKDLSSHGARYCYPDDPPIPLSKVPGVRFYVLGPPRNEGLLQILEAQTALHSERLTLHEATAFYSAVLATFGATGLEASQEQMHERINRLSCPFTGPLAMTEDEAEAYEVNGQFFFEKHYGFAEDDPEQGWRRIDNDWLAAAGQLALHMDEYTNNTSLVLAIELTGSGKVLLFPGDAQIGNWLSWKDTSWIIEDEDGEEKTITGMDLVQSTVFYKVGHHGSHNATLVSYLKEMRDHLVAMIPVNEKWAKGKTRPWEHPGTALLKEIKEQARGRIIRADTRLPDSKPTALSQHEWTEFLDNVQQDTGPKKLWIQYTVPG